MLIEMTPEISLIAASALGRLPGEPRRPWVTSTSRNRSSASWRATMASSRSRSGSDA